MSAGPELLLISAVAAVGILHTIVPDHWVPITLIARQRGWSKAETARVSLQAGIGHVGSTLLIALLAWLAGAALAARFGNAVDSAASIALIAFGGWIAISALRALRPDGHHGHGHAHHATGAAGAIHGPEQQGVPTERGLVTLSIFEDGVRPRFRVTGPAFEAVKVETQRENGRRDTFLFANHGTYWESIEEIPEPHQFEVAIILEQGGGAQRFATRFVEHAHDDGHGHHHHHHHGPGEQPAPEDDALYAPLPGDVALLTRHIHAHRHGRDAVHTHWHDHRAATVHAVAEGLAAEPPLHEHRHRMAARTALLLILGSSPMVEGIPAFFAAGRYGLGLIAVMAAVFALSTIATYVLLCVASTAGLQRIRLGAFERYGEVLSGGFIALVGVVFGLWPLL
jgi:hypothetical protein